jgi:hypothetical protein
VKILYLMSIDSVFAIIGLTGISAATGKALDLSGWMKIIFIGFLFKVFSVIVHLTIDAVKLYDFGQRQGHSH